MITGHLRTANTPVYFKIGRLELNQKSFYLFVINLKLLNKTIIMLYEYNIYIYFNIVFNTLSLLQMSNELIFKKILNLKMKILIKKLDLTCFEFCIKKIDK